MRATFVIPAVLAGVFLLLSLTYIIFPSSRPAFVQGLFLRSKGFTPATSAEDALVKLNKAIRARNYEAAELYLAGEYAEYFARGRKRAEELAQAIDKVEESMAAHGVFSRQVTRMLYWMDPLPPFRHAITREEEDDVIAVLNWEEDADKANIPEPATHAVNPLLLHALLVSGRPLPREIAVRVVPDGGGWKVVFPVEDDERHVRDCVEALEARGATYRNALHAIRERIRLDPVFRQHAERNFFDDVAGAR